MSITVDTVQLRFHIKPDYDQQQIQQLQSDLKQSQKNIEAERKVMEKYARTLDETREKLREAVEERNKLAKQKSRTAEEMQQLGELNQTIGYLEQAQVQDYADLESIMIFNEDGICRDVSTGCMYIRVDRDPDPWEIDGQGESYWQEVDQYRDLDRADSTSTLELKITPAPMGYIGESGVEVIDLGTTDGWHDNISGTVDVHKRNRPFCVTQLH